MGLAEAIRSQFGNPRGVLGSVAGKVMANRASNRERNLWTVSLLEIRPSDRVLEVGFGPGLAIEEISKIVTTGLVAGVDHSDVMLRQARERNAAAIQQGRVDLRLASVADLPDFGEPFDKVFAVNVLMFWDDPVARLRDLRQVMKPGGLIAITHQPRGSRVTDDLTREKGEEIATSLADAGFSQVRVEMKPMRPVAVACAIGLNPGG